MALKLAFWIPHIDAHKKKREKEKEKNGLTQRMAVRKEKLCEKTEIQEKYV